MELLQIIIASSAVAAAVSGIFSMLQSGVNYRNEFYKKIIDKRFESYEMIEKLLYFFSTAVHDPSDNCFYHIIFSVEENPFQKEYSYIISKLSKSNIWISEKIRKKLINLNRFIMENNINFNSIEDGKKYYKELGDIRNELLIITKRDVLKLYKIKKTLKEEVSIGMEYINEPSK